MLWIFPQEEAVQLSLTIALAQQVRATRAVSPTLNINPLAIEVDRERNISTSTR